MASRRGHRHVCAGLSLAVACLTACSDKPYTPFTTTAAPTTTAVASGSAAVVAPSADFVGRRSEPPADATRIVLGDKAIASPDAPILQVLAERPTDGASPSWAIAVRGQDGVPRDVVVATSARQTLEVIVPLAGRSDARHDVALSEVAPRLVWISDVAHAGDGTSEETVLLVRVRPDGTSEVALRARRASLALGESVALVPRMEKVEEESTFTVDVRLTGMAEPFEPAADLVVPVVFFDRGGALVRDTAEPAKTFAARVVEAASKTRTDKTSGAGLERLAKVARLLGIVCADAGTPVVAFGATEITCQAPALSAELSFAMGSLALRTKDVPAALAAREELARGAKSPRLAQLDKALDKEVPKRATSISHRVPLEGADKGVLAPLTYDPDGKLLLASPDGVSRLGDDGVEKVDVLPWPRTFAVNQHGAALDLTGARATCRFPFVEIEARSEGTKIVASAPAVASLRASTKGCVERALPLQPIAIDGETLHVAIGFDVYRVRARGSGLEVRRAPMLPPGMPPSSPGSARSAAGGTHALVSGGALLVSQQGKAERWTSDAISAARQCVPHPDQARIACTTTTEALVVEPKPR